MSEAARKLAPTARLRVAIYALDLLRRTALSRVVAEAGHIVVGAEDAADVVLADGDCVPGETRPVVTLGGTGGDRPGMLSRDAGADRPAWYRAASGVALPAMRRGRAASLRRPLTTSVRQTRPMDRARSRR